MPQLVVTNPSTTVPLALSSVPKNYRTCTMIAGTALTGPTAAPNTGLVRIGLSAVNNQQPIEFQPGVERVFYAASGQMLDLSQYYLSVANANDGLILIFQ